MTNYSCRYVNYPTAHLIGRRERGSERARFGANTVSENRGDANGERSEP
ncbi:hypothetical protein [Natrinema sp. DC36]|nr:hypothetical protein [Natrinema sp. DC36]